MRLMEMSKDSLNHHDQRPSRYVNNYTSLLISQL